MARLRVGLLVISISISAAAACGDDGGAKPDAPGVDAAPDAAIPTTLAEIMPRVVPTSATAVLAHPKVVAITYDNDTNRAALEQFYTDFGASPAWAAQTAEYGVGTLTVATPQHLTGNAPANPTDDMVLNTLTANLTGATPAWGAPDPNADYAFFFPTGSILDDGTGSKCCTDYDGYHYDTTVAGVDVAYSIHCTCPGFDGAGITDIQQLTVVASHELVETVTDPHSDVYGFAQTDDAHVVWTYVTEGEVADMCEYADTAYLLAPQSPAEAIQRSWSNAAAAASHDPCVPEAATPYYQTAPDQPDPITVTIFDAPVASHGLRVAVGATGMLTLRVFADDPNAGPFTVTIGDVLEDYYGGAAALAFPQQPSGTYHAGDVITVPVMVKTKDSGMPGGEAFDITTTPVGGGPATYFYGLVGQ